MKIPFMKNQKGLTLLEVLISMIIMSIALLLLLNMAMVALDSNNWSNNTTIATQLMQEKLEQLRNMSTPTSGEVETNGIEMKWTVSNVGSYLRRIDISAKWVDISKNEVTNSLSTFIKTNTI